MALIRAEIRNRLGDSSIYDGIVERTDDFESEKMLQSIHPGSMMLCLNYPDDNSTNSTEETSNTSDLYIKRLDGSWELVLPMSAGVTPEDIVAATGEMTHEQAAAVLSNLGVGPSNFVVTFTKINSASYSVDKTYEEVLAAYQAGATIVFSNGAYSGIANFWEGTGGSTDAFAGTICTVDLPEPILLLILGEDGLVAAGTYSSVTPASVATAIGSMTSAQSAQARSDLGAEPEKFVITLEDGEEPGTFVADKSAGEILAAYQSDKILMVKYENGYENGVYEFIGMGQHHSIAFVKIDDGEYTSGHLIKFINYDGTTWTLDEKYYQPATYMTYVADSTPTITPVHNTIYKCGTLTSLTITDPPATGSYVIKFTSGSTATTTTIPSSIIFPEAFAAEANTRYEINIEDGFAVAVGWPVS